MKQPPPIFSGILAVFALSFAVLAMAPAIQLGGLQPQVDEDTGDIYPIDVSGVGAEGRAVYVSRGMRGVPYRAGARAGRRGGP